jgi:hypothetical protein
MAILVLNVLNKRNKETDALLGRELADGINVMYKACTTIIPRLDEIFPLQWMPIFGGTEEDYVPPPRPGAEV